MKVTEIEHFDLAGNDEIQVVLLTLKSLGLVPPNPMLAILRATAWLLARVNFTGLLVVPVLRVPKFAVEGVRLADGKPMRVAI